MARLLVVSSSLLALLVALVACGGNSDVKVSLDPNLPCLERPGLLARPPTGKLPCELLPPTP